MTLTVKKRTYTISMACNCPKGTMDSCGIAHRSG